MNTGVLKIRWSPTKKGFNIWSKGAHLPVAFVPAMTKREKEAVIEFLNRRLNDNPEMQIKFGVLGVDSIEWDTGE